MSVARERDALLVIELNVVTGDLLITPPQWLPLEQQAKLGKAVRELEAFASGLRSAVA